MFCQKCGRKIDGKFCGHCGETNILFEKNNTVESQSVYTQQNTQYNQVYAPATYTGVSFATPVKLEKKNYMPYVFLILHGILALIISYLADIIVNNAFSVIETLEEHYRLVALNSLIVTCGLLVVLAIGFAIVRDIRLIVIALGSKWIAQFFANALFAVIRYAYSEIFIFDEPLEYSVYTGVESVISAILVIFAACLLYKLISDKMLKEKETK